jgi:hypothetical protein
MEFTQSNLRASCLKSKYKYMICLGPQDKCNLNMSRIFTYTNQIAAPDVTLKYYLNWTNQRPQIYDLEDLRLKLLKQWSWRSPLEIAEAQNTEDCRKNPTRHIVILDKEGLWNPIVTRSVLKRNCVLYDLINLWWWAYRLWFTGLWERSLLNWCKHFKGLNCLNL